MNKIAGFSFTCISNSIFMWKMLWPSFTYRTLFIHWFRTFCNKFKTIFIKSNSRSTVLWAVIDETVRIIPIPKSVLENVYLELYCNLKCRWTLTLQELNFKEHVLLNSPKLHCWGDIKITSMDLHSMVWMPFW